MTDFSSLTSSSTIAASAAVEANNAVQAETARNEALTDFDEFLTLLTAQLQNQDPLNPLDSTEFVAQLASFSSVEQQIGTNERLDTLIGASNGAELQDLATWIGQDVTASGAGFVFDGETMELDMPGDPSADRASAVIRSADGREVATVAASPDGGAVIWDGTTATGGTAAAGVYRVEFVYGFDQPDGTTRTETRAAEASGRVVEARIDDGAPRLRLENGAEISPAAVTSVRTPRDEDA